MTEVPVLIVGGGPVGLTASVCLSRLGVRSLLVERHPGTTIHPKARNLNVRTMEVLRPWRIEAELQEQALPRSWTGHIIYTRTLDGEELGRMETASFASESASSVSPSTSLLSSQDVYEPIFHRLAERLGPAELRFGCELEDFRLESGGVRATLHDRGSGERSEVKSRYLLACDGWNSAVRRRLQIEMEGPAEIGHFVNVYFRADLCSWVDHRPALLYFVTSPEANGVFQPLDGRGRWLCQISYDGRASTFSEYTPERCLDWIRRAVGSSEAEAEILSIGRWTMNATVASSFRQGPVFLAGDAAHQLPPTGGFGMNTGVHDVHNLAWKIAGVLGGWARPALLDSYDRERRPVARFNADRSLENSRMVAQINRTAMRGSDPAKAVADSRRYGNFTGMDIGFHYEEGALIGDGSAKPEVADPVVDFVPTARPGHRAPHIVLRHRGAEISALDLFDGAFTLLAGSDGAAWVEGAHSAMKGSAIPIQCFAVGTGLELEDPTGGWADLYGVEAGGAVLVRPDGHVGWRSRSSVEDPSAEMAGVLGVLTG